MIPKNIKSDDILRAIEEVEKSGIPKERNSEKYDLEYNEKFYPPKYIVSLANKYANEKELDHSEFSGGDETNDFLRSLGFNIVIKQDDVSQLKNLLTFIDLQKFLLEGMQMQANYQPIMIRTLLQSVESQLRMISLKGSKNAIQKKKIRILRMFLSTTYWKNMESLKRMAMSSF